MKSKTRKITDLEVANKLIKLSQSAKDRGIEFDLSFKKVRQLVSVEKCYYTGTIFQETGTYSRSVDRVDSSKGYELSNMEWVTHSENSRRGAVNRHATPCNS